MKNTFIIILIALFSMSLSAQVSKSRKELRAEKKAQEIEKRNANRLVQEKLVAEKTFVLEAQQVFNKIGDMFSLNSSTNFVYLNGDDAVIQLGFDGLIGWNGVGGITIKGKISRYIVEDENKNKPIYIRMTIQGSEGFFDITMWISSNGKGEAEVVDIRGNRIKFTGDIVSLDDTRVFIGHSR